MVGLCCRISRRSWTGRRSPFAGAPEGKGGGRDRGAREVGAAGRSKPAIQMLEQTLALGGCAVARVAGGRRAAGPRSERRLAPSSSLRRSLITADSKPLAVAKQLTSAGPLRSGPPTLSAASEEPTGSSIRWRKPTPRVRHMSARSTSARSSSRRHRAGWTAIRYRAHSIGELGV